MGNVASGLLHALGDAAEVHALGALGLESGDVGDDGGVGMERQAAGDDLHVAASLHQDDLGALSVERGVHGLDGLNNGQTLGNGDVEHLVGAALVSAAEGDGHDLVGHGASACNQLCGRSCVLSDDQCLHEYPLCLSFA